MEHAHLGDRSARLDALRGLSLASSTLSVAAALLPAEQSAATTAAHAPRAAAHPPALAPALAASAEPARRGLGRRVRLVHVHLGMQRQQPLLRQLVDEQLAFGGEHGGRGGRADQSRDGHDELQQLLVQQQLRPAVLVVLALLLQPFLRAVVQLHQWELVHATLLLQRDAASIAAAALTLATSPSPSAAVPIPAAQSARRGVDRGASRSLLLGRVPVE